MQNFTGINADTATVLPVHSEQCPNSEQLSTLSSFFVTSLVLVSTVNVFTLFAALIGNFLIVKVLRRVSSIHPPTRTLFYSLTASDLCVGLIVQPLNLIYMISSVTGNATLCFSVLPHLNVLGFAMCGISLLTTTEISVDRLLAIRLKLSYRHVVSLRRARLAVVVTWLASLASGLTSLWSNDAFIKLQIIGVFLSITVSTFSYVWIHAILRKRAKQKQRQIAWDAPSQSAVSVTNSFSTVRYKKTVSTALWVHCALLLCFLPYMIVAAFWAVYGGNEVVMICHAFALALLYFNSALNPVLYFWKIKGVRDGIKEMLNNHICK